MTRGRILKIAAATLVAALGCRATLSCAAQSKPDESLAQVCARVGNDDTVRPYSPSLQAATARAFKTLFPRAKADPDPTTWQTQANYRCMNGKVWVCFIGANLPCAKINTARDNPGANAFCREQPDADVVPAVATGHDAAYSYTCHDGRAVVGHATWQLDSRGFAKALWTELPDGP